MKNRRLRTKTSKVEGDEFLFFILHNLLSMSIFLVYSLSTNLHKRTTQTLQEMISQEFLFFILQVFGLTLVFGVMARLLVYTALYLYYEYRKNKQIKQWNVMIKGINAMNISYLVRCLIGASIFAIGSIVLLQSTLFTDQNGLTYTFSYIIVKFFITAWTYYKFK